MAYLSLSTLVVREERLTGPIQSTERPGVTELLKQLILIGIALTSERELSTLLERIVAEARRFTNAEGGTLFLRSGDELRFAVAQNDVLSERMGEKEMRRYFADQPLCLTERCLMVLAISAMTVVVRRHRETSMVAAAALSNFMGSLVSLPFAHDIAHVGGNGLAILAMFGCLQVALGLTFYMLGSRLLPSGQASLIATLETPLMPFWIWVAFRELPAVHALIGGALVIGAVIADIAGDARSRRPS